MKLLVHDGNEGAEKQLDTCIDSVIVDTIL